MRWLIFLFTIYFGILSVAPNFQGAQLLNVSTLVSHYKADSKGTKQSFLSFLADHYLKSNHPDDKQHESLPFKSFNSHGLSVLLFQSSQSAFKTELLFHQPQYFSTCFGYLNHYFLQDFSSIFHPPKLS